MTKDQAGVPVPASTLQQVDGGAPPRHFGNVARRRLGLASERGEPTWSFAFVLLLIYEAYLYLELGWRWQSLGDLRLQFFMGAVLGVISVAKLASGRTRDVVPIRPYVIAMLGCLLVMTVFSIRPALSADVLWKHVLELALYGFFVASLVTTVDQLKWVLIVFLLCFFKMGLEGMIGTITGEMIWENQEIPRLNGPTPIYRHPNSFSGTQLGALAFVFAFWPIANWWQRAFLVTQIVFIFNVVLRTGSRTGYVACFFLLVTVFLKAKNRGRLFLMICAAVIALGPFVPKAYLERASTIFASKSAEKEGSSILLRQEILDDATAVFLEHPFGVGVAMFPVIREQQFGRVQDTHNLYLEVATNLGVIGFVIFVLFVGSMLKVLSQTSARCAKLAASLGARAGPDSEEVPLQPGVLALQQDMRFVSAVAQAGFYFVITRLYLGLFGHDLYEIYWWFAAGITTVVWRLSMNWEREYGLTIGLSGLGSRESRSERIGRPTQRIIARRGLDRR